LYFISLQISLIPIEALLRGMREGTRSSEMREKMATIQCENDQISKQIFGKTAGVIDYNILLFDLISF
jgi:hypothetical protein